MLENTNTHACQEIASTVRVVVNSTVELGGHILADTVADVLFTTRMVLDKVLHIIQDAFDQDPFLVFIDNKVLEFIPGEHGQIFKTSAIGKLALDSSNLLFLHLDLALGHFVGGELLQIISETGKRKQLDEPLCGVVLIINNGIAIILREFVVEVVVSFTHGHKSSDPMVAWGVMIIE